MAQGFSERVHWSRETWSLNDLVHMFGNQFPIIVNTTSGFYGANEVEVISAGEVSLHTYQVIDIIFDSSGHVWIKFRQVYRPVL